MIAEMLLASAKAADDLKIRFGSPAVQAGRAIAALPNVEAAIAHAEQVVQHLRVLRDAERADVPTDAPRAAE